MSNFIKNIIRISGCLLILASKSIPEALAANSEDLAEAENASAQPPKAQRRSFQDMEKQTLQELFPLVTSPKHLSQLKEVVLTGKLKQMLKIYHRCASAERQLDNPRDQEILDALWQRRKLTELEKAYVKNLHLLQIFIESDQKNEPKS